MDVAILRKSNIFASHLSLITEKFKKQFYLFTCILPDYVSHESSKDFWRKNHLGNMRACFLSTQPDQTLFYSNHYGRATRGPRGVKKVKFFLQILQFFDYYLWSKANF